MTLRGHIDRGRWWTDETTRYILVRVCQSCGGDGFGQYGDGSRCHGCGRLVENAQQPWPSASGSAAEGDLDEC